MAGTLFVIATPLGHLDDLAPRAVETLRSVACIACEDTRRTAKLLARYGVETPTLSCHRFNEAQRLEPVLRRLAAGEDVALVSDGGTPGLSDPGSLLVRVAAERGFDVRPVPGPSAVAALLSVSGLAGDRFVFDGFLPHRAGERRRRLRQLADERRTVVLYEAPHRIHATLADIEEVLGPRHLVLGRELTKVHESVLRGNARQVLERLGDETRGEFTLVLAGAPADAPPATTDARATEVLECWRAALDELSGDTRTALRRAAKRLGLKRAELYRLLSELGEAPD
jgi:16S rRNA (cytidine1402-2'-O)-methyltransferase